MYANSQIVGAAKKSASIELAGVSRNPSTLQQAFDTLDRATGEMYSVVDELRTRLYEGGVLMQSSPEVAKASSDVPFPVTTPLNERIAMQHARIRDITEILRDLLNRLGV